MKCKVNFEGINEVKNILWLVDIIFGSGIYYINFCLDSKGYNMLIMFINCLMWNVGK